MPVEHIVERAVVPASPSNENAMPVHEGHAGSAEASKGMVDKSVMPGMPRDVGVTPVPQPHEHESHADPSSHDGHADHWAGPDGPSRVARDTA
jgi:hypothetical protein